jgi:hypothetical protein
MPATFNVFLNYSIVCGSSTAELAQSELHGPKYISSSLLEFCFLFQDAALAAL